MGGKGYSVLLTSSFSSSSSSLLMAVERVDEEDKNESGDITKHSRVKKCIWMKHRGKTAGLHQVQHIAHRTSSLCCPASLSSIVSSIVCLLILLRVADRLASLESSLNVSRAFLIVASFRAMASLNAAGEEGEIGGWGVSGMESMR
jgi:hypothetical protein